MTGLLLIVLGLVQVFQALSKYAPPDRISSPLFMFITALLFTVGAALIWWNGKRWNANSHTQN
jgi:hypothetical protein